MLLRERTVPRWPKASGRSNSQADTSASRPSLSDGLTRFPALGYSRDDLAGAVATSFTFMPHLSCVTFPEELTWVFMRVPSNCQEWVSHQDWGRWGAASQAVTDPCGTSVTHVES